MIGKELEKLKFKLSRFKPLNIFLW